MSLGLDLSLNLHRRTDCCDVGPDFHSFGADSDGVLKTQVRGTGTPTFARSSEATVTDFEGLQKNALANELRFQYGRRVENLLTDSSDITGWTRGANTTLTFGDADTGTRVQMPDDLSTFAHEIFIVGRVYRFRFEVKLGDSEASANLIAGGQENGFGPPYDGLLTIVPTSSWVAYSLLVDATGYAVSTNLGFDGASGSALDVRVRRLLIEDVTGQANQNPSEYVSAGIESDQYHGAMVDGVKYFDYLNGNTVDGNGVVTDAQGATLGVDILESDRGLSDWTEGANVTLGDTVTAHDGTTLTNNGLVMDITEGDFRIYNSVATEAGAPYRYVFYAKAGTEEWCRARFYTQSAINSQYFHLSGAGAIGSATAGVTEAKITALSGGWYKCSMTVVETASSAARFVMVYVAEGDGDDSLANLSVQTGIYVDFPEVLPGVDDWRALFEPASTNYADGDDDLSGGAETVDLTASGTGDYTLSVSGDADVTVAAGTATGTGFGQATAGSPVTFNLSVAGTVTLTLNSGGLDVWAGLAQKQVEKASFASSWIPTSGATVTRTADDGTPMFDYANWSQTKGTWYADVWWSDITTDVSMIALKDTTTTNVLRGVATGDLRSDDDTAVANANAVIVDGGRHRAALDFSASADERFSGGKDVAGAGSWGWSPDAGYDGDFDSTSQFNIFFNAPIPMGIRDLYGHTARKGKAWVEDNQ